jgi:hypothetical protein
VTTSSKLSAVPDPEEGPTLDEAAHALTLWKERILLGTACQSRDSFETIARVGHDLQFERPEHQDLWHVLKTLADDPSKPFHPTTALDALLKLHLKRSRKRRPDRRTEDPGTTIHACLADASSIDSATYLAAEMHRGAKMQALRTTLHAVYQQVIVDKCDDSALEEALERLATANQPLSTGLIDGSQANGWGATGLVAAALKGDTPDVVPTMFVNTDGIAGLYPGRLHTISGEPESGKTWIALAAAAQRLNGGGSVLLIDLEDSESTAVARLRTLGVSEGALSDRFEYIKPHGPLTPASRKALRPSLIDRDLVIVDAVTGALTLHGLDGNSANDVEEFYQPMRWIASHGPAVLMIDHVTKNSETRGHWASGSGHKLAGIDGAAFIVRRGTPFRPGGVGHATVIIAKDRVGAVRGGVGGSQFCRFDLDSTGDESTWAFTSPVASSIGVEAELAKISNPACADAVIEFLRVNPASSKNRIEKGVSYGAAAIRTSLAELISAGVVVVTDGKQGAKLHSLAGDEVAVLETSPETR